MSLGSKIMSKQKQTWSLQDHNRLYGKNFNGGAASWILNNIDFNSVLEFGCGPGYYCKFWSDNDIRYAHGIEPEQMDQSCFINDGCEQFEYNISQQPEPEGILPAYDLIVSIEVMEHIDRIYHNKVFDYFLSKSPRTIIFSAATPGQLGTGHIACREEEDWRNEFLERGMLFDETQTRALRLASNQQNINHIKNLQVFNKPE
tara:strand:- start:3466 stop:4071 length:606 start_codon:yes stop_codon:yes gene_type:complete